MIMGNDKRTRDGYRNVQSAQNGKSVSAYSKDGGTEDRTLTFDGRKTKLDLPKIGTDVRYHRQDACHPSADGSRSTCQSIG